MGASGVGAAGTTGPSATASTVGATGPSSNLAGSIGTGIATGSGSGSAAGNGAGSTGNGVAGNDGWSDGNYYGMGTAQEKARAYSLRAVYFRADLFKSKSDCLTSAYAQQLPLDLCK